METGRTDQHRTSDAPSPDPGTTRELKPGPAAGTSTDTSAGTGTRTKTGTGTGTGTDDSTAALARPAAPRRSWPQVVPHPTDPAARPAPAPPPPPRYNQHRQQPAEPVEAGEAGGGPARFAEADADPEARRAAHRSRATGFATGVLHTLGFTLLAVYEYFRSTAQTLSEAQRAAGGPETLRDIAGLQADLAHESWYTVVSDLARAVTFDQPRATLWSAVFLAVLLRLNRSGPPRVQLGLSVLSAGYCALLALLWFPFLYALGSVAFLALAGTGVLVWAATRH